MKTLLLRRTRLIATQIFKSVNGYNPISMRSMVLRKHYQYNFRDKIKLILPHFSHVTHGQRSSMYYGSHDFKAATNISILND